MWYVVKTTMISILILVVVHQLYIYCKDTYTIKKNKDILGHQTQKYKLMMDEIQEKNEREKRELIEKLTKGSDPVQTHSDNTTDYLTDKDRQQMDQDLTEFIKTIV